MTFAADLARARPDQFALVDPEQVLSWSDVETILRPATQALLSEPLGELRRVAIFAENHAHTVLAYAAITLAGAAAVPVNFHLTVEEAAYILADSDADLVVVDAQTAERGVAAAHLAGVGRIVGLGVADMEGVTPWKDWLSAAPEGQPPTGLAPRPSMVYTSGTTGRPKGVELPPTAFAGGRDIGEHLEQLAANRMVGFGPHLVVGPLYHSGPLTATRLFLGGTPLVVLGRFDPEQTLAAITRHRVGSTIMVPTHFVRLLSLPDHLRGRADLSSLQYVRQVGAACPVDVKRAMIDWWGPILHESYGASEVGTVCSISSDEWLRRPGSVGRAVDPFEVLVLDAHGREVPAGTTGRLYFRDRTGRGIIYHGDPSKTAAAHIEPGVFTLGEIGHVDADGYVFITGRSSDLVVSGGVNIYPAEAEQVLALHPGVADVACIGVPDPEMGEQLRALVVPTDPAAGLDPEELQRWCRDRLTHYKCPRSVEVVPDLRRTAVGKLDKASLRAPYWEDVPAG